MIEIDAGSAKERAEAHGVQQQGLGAVVSGEPVPQDASQHDRRAY